jgi:hypothetical protein
VEVEDGRRTGRKRRLEEVAGGPKIRWTWWTAGTRLGFFASTPFFFDCFSSFLYLAEFFSEPRREAKRI